MGRNRGAALDGARVRLRLSRACPGLAKEYPTAHSCVGTVKLVFYNITKEYLPIYISYCCIYIGLMFIEINLVDIFKSISKGDKNIRYVKDGKGIYPLSSISAIEEAIPSNDKSQKGWRIEFNNGQFVETRDDVPAILRKAGRICSLD